MDNALQRSISRKGINRRPAQAEGRSLLFRRPISADLCIDFYWEQYSSVSIHIYYLFVELLGPFYRAIAVPSVTRCRCRRCRCCGHRCAGSVWQWWCATVATPSEWQCGVRRLTVANGPNIFQRLLVCRKWLIFTHPTCIFATVVCDPVRILSSPLVSEN